MTVQTTVMTKARTAFNQAFAGILADVEIAVPVEAIYGLNTAITYDEIGTTPEEPKNVVSITKCEADIQIGLNAQNDVSPLIIPEIIHKHGAHLQGQGIFRHRAAVDGMEVLTFSFSQEKAWNGDQEGS